MSYMSYFSEPIVTSRGIIVGSTYDGQPYFAGNFHSITQFPSCNQRPKTYQDDCITIGQLFTENRAIREAQNRKR
jgi:hypothetical protein